MAYYNPDDFKFDPKRHVRQEPEYGFNMSPGLESQISPPPLDQGTLDWLKGENARSSRWQAQGLSPAMPEPARVPVKPKPDLKTDEYRTTPYRNMPSDTPDFSGIERYTPEAKKTTVARTPTRTAGLSYPTQTRTSAFGTPRRSYTTQRAAAPIPYGSQSFWQPEEGAEMPEMGELPEYLAPEMGELPEYDMPEMDRERISELTELGMGAGMGKLRTGLGSALRESRYSSNPMVRAMMRKRALSGYGEGITDVRTGAHRTAMSEYMPEFQATVGKSQAEYRAGLGKMQSEFQGQLTKSQAEYQSKVQKIRDLFQTGMADYRRKGRQVTTPVEGRRGTASTDPRYRIKWGV